MNTWKWAPCVGLGIMLAHAGHAARFRVVDEDFDGLTLGNSTGINQEISGAGLRLHNHLVGQVVTPHASFSTASGQAFQLTTGTNPTGGWGLLSADNSPRAVTLIQGENIILSFDMYVQAVPASPDPGSVTLKLALTGGTDQSRAFTELTGASAGSVVHVTWTVPVSAGMATATAISPVISFEGNQNNFNSEGPNSDGTELDVAQIDNLVLEVPTAAPTAQVYYLDADGGSDSDSGTSPGEAWASLSKASSVTFNAGDSLLLQCGDTFNGKLVLDNDNGISGNPIIVASYGTGDRPVIDAEGYLAGVHITSCDYIEIRDLEITGDGGAHIDGSDGTDRYGVYINNSSGANADGITVSNVYFHTIYPALPTASEGHNPTTYFGTAIDARGQSGNHSESLQVVDCHFENMGYKVLNLSRQNKTQVLNNLMENIGGPCMVPNRCDDLLVRGNTVDGSGQYTDPRMHGRGSGIWPINCNRVLIEKNAFMHARGRYDSCGVHLDIGNTDAVVQYNLSMDNEGGFVEILGVNSNCTYRYNVSINDGARRAGSNENGLGVGDGHTLLFSGHNFSGQDRAGPYYSYVYNNTIYVTEEQLSSFSFEQTTWGVLVANNLFFIDGHTEDESPLWRGDYPAGMPETVLWTNNLYQRGGIFPETWIFTEGSPIYGNPDLPNPGGLTAEDYFPTAGSMVEGRGVSIPLIPGDAVGLRTWPAPDGSTVEGLAVTEDFSGNPIAGAPDIGAVEIGGGISTLLGSAFYGWPEEEGDDTAVMAAVPGPAGSEYYFAEVTGNYGGDDSGWQSDTNYSDTGLLPNTEYLYTVTVRDASDVNGGISVVEQLIPQSSPPFPEPELLDEDFSSSIDPDNTVSPFPVNTWYLDDSLTWREESQIQSVTDVSGQMQLGFGYDEIMLQYYTDQTWDTSRDYELSGDWEIDTVFTHHTGVIVGFSEHDPATGALLQRFGESTVGDLVSPTAGETGSFTLSVTAAELQAYGVSETSRIGIFFHRDDDGMLYSQSSDKSDIYHIDNLFMRLYGDDLDEDGDGIPDSAETLAGLDPKNPADGAWDLDLDGMSNNSEYLAGTGMNDSNDVFSVSASAVSGDPAVVIQDANVLSNRLYILEHKPSLMSADPWIAVDAASGTAEDGSGDYSFVPAGSVTQGFFRVRVEWE